ncbi:MAG: fumarylacetoacetate hydrolase family protein, partial [Pseudomonadota bacterium]
MRFVIPTSPAPTLPVLGTDARFPIRRVYCIGRNYAAHSIEMGGNPDRETPFFFQKNPDNLDPSGVFPYPAKSSDVHHEVEMVVALKSDGVAEDVIQSLSRRDADAAGFQSDDHLHLVVHVRGFSG